MMGDRNKSELTCKVTAAAVLYLEERGCKPLETEVPVALGWIADLAGVLCPTETELQNLKLIPRKPRWGASDDQILKWQEKRDAAERIITFLVEVKTSRGDFLGDKKWTEDLPCDGAYLAIPKGMVAPEEYPNGWGVLEYIEASDWVRCAKPPVLRAATAEQQRDLILAVAVRRDHHTRYARMREFQREERIQRTESVSLARTTDAMKAMRDIVRGRLPSYFYWNGQSYNGTAQLSSPAECVAVVLDHRRIKNMRQDLLDELAQMWATCPEAILSSCSTGGAGL